MRSGAISKTVLARRSDQTPEDLAFRDSKNTSSMSQKKPWP